MKPSQIALTALLLLSSSQTQAAPVLRAYTLGLKPLSPLADGNLADEVNALGSRGETVAKTLKLKSDKCLDISPMIWPKNSAVQTTVSKILTFKTLKPSFKGARVGDWLDPIVPAQKACPDDNGTVWLLMELKIGRNAKPGNYTAELKIGSTHMPVKLTIWKMLIPEKPTLALYSELTTWYLLLGHYGRWHEGEESLSKQYITRMLQHRIAPLKHWVAPLDPTAKPFSLRGAFEKQVIAPLPTWANVTLWFPFPPKPGKALSDYFSQLGAAARDVSLEGRALLYLWDEPKKEEFADLLLAATELKKRAPGIRALVTTTLKPEIGAVVDTLVPVLDQYDRKGFASPSDYTAWKRDRAGRELWLYVSCMSHGCDDSADSGSPDFVIDRGESHIRSFAWLGWLYGADSLLYYSVNNGYQAFSNGRDPWQSLYDFSGNADGTLFYPGRPGFNGLAEHRPIESLRLKLWRQASYDAEYLHWMDTSPQKLPGWPAQAKALVRSARDWEKAALPYEQLREKIGDFLNQTH